MAKSKKVRTIGIGTIIVFLLGICGIIGSPDTKDSPITPLPSMLIPTRTLTRIMTLTPSSTATITTIPKTATALFGSRTESSCVPRENEIQVATVTRVIDGDTIVVEIEGHEYRLRYIGIDSPEMGNPFGDIAKKMNEDLVLGKKVFLIKDVSEFDPYDRLLRYVFVGDIFVNYKLVYDGAARAGTWRPDISCDEVLRKAQHSAEMLKVGIWQSTPTAAILIPTPSSADTGRAIPIIPNPTSVPAGNCDPSYPTVCIPPPPPDLDCKDIKFRRFQVLPPDPHNFDGDGNGIGCESG